MNYEEGEIAEVSSPSGNNGVASPQHYIEDNINGMSKTNRNYELL